jgi:dipeptidase E
VNEVKTCLLTSSFENDFTDDFVRELKEYSKVNKKFAFVASSFENHARTEKYCAYILDLFKKIGVIFEEINIIDYHVSKEDAEQIILKTDVVWLSGGDTLMQMKYFNEYNLREILNRYDGTIIGMSAGSINMADKVVLPRDKEDNVPELSVYKGLGLVSINIEPHLDFNRKEHIEDIKNASRLAPIYGIYDGSFILVAGDKVEVFGDYCIFENESVSFYNIEDKEKGK